MKASGIFQGLRPEEVSAALAGQLRRRYAPGEAVVVEGGPPGTLYIIEQGAAIASVEGDPASPRRELGRLGPGDTIGEMSLLTGQPVSATVRADTMLDVVTLSQADVWSLGARFPVIFYNIATMLARRLQAAQAEPFETLEPVEPDGGGKA